MPTTRDELYHGTSFEGVVGTFQSNAMFGSDGGGVYGVSLTTDVEVAHRFAIGKSAERAQTVQWNVELGAKHEEYFSVPEISQWVIDPATGGGGGILVFDPVLLSEHFKYQQIDEIGDGSEREIRVLGDPRGILACITGVEIRDPNAFSRYCEELLRRDASYSAAVSAINDLIRADLPPPQTRNSGFALSF